MTQLSFCSADDIAGAVQVASRHNSNDGSNIYDRYRRAVSQDIIRYTRRNWDYATGIVEYFDSPCRMPREQLLYYPFKVPFDTTVTPVLKYALDRDFANVSGLTYGTDFWFDQNRASPCIVVMNAWATSQAANAYQLTYAAGLKAAYDIDNNLTDVYDTSEVPNLRELCAQEAAARIEAYLNRTEGQQQHGALRSRTIEKKQIGGFMPEVARSLEYYRRIYVART
jgi:hypothetical protein